MCVLFLFFFLYVDKIPRLSKARPPNPPGPFCRLLLVSVAFVCFCYKDTVGVVLLTVVCWIFLGPYHPGQASGHSLPGLAELSQTHSSHPPPAFGQHPPAPSHSAGHSLPGIGQAMQHPSPQSINRERERDSRERELIERQRQEELAHREREQREREREQLERQRETQHHPVQSHTGSIPLHQPVANKVPSSIHGPNGLLSNLGGNAPNGPQGSMQSSSGPAGIFGSQMRHGEGTPGSFMQHPAGPPGQAMLGFGASGPQVPGNVAALTQGQQPILNVSRHQLFSSCNRNSRRDSDVHVAWMWPGRSRVRVADPMSPLPACPFTIRRL